MGTGDDRKATERFSARVDNYIRFRPDYPDDIMDCLTLEAGLTPDCVIADIGSGTGILSEKFLKNGNTVFGVEPNDEMRAAAERLLHTHAAFKSIKGTAEDTTLAAGKVDMVVAGQAFHWFDRDACRAELARILKRDGWVALVWNTRRTDTTPFLEEYEGFLRAFSIDYRQVDHRNVTAESLAQFFPVFRKRVFPNLQNFDYEGLKGRLLSSSYAPLEGHPNFEPMLRELGRIFAEYQVGGLVQFLYDTELYFGQLAQSNGLPAEK